MKKPETTQENPRSNFYAYIFRINPTFFGKYPTFPKKVYFFSTKISDDLFFF